ncbi:hypothetical protein [Hymenobacter mucosus]|uniref:hypothetical protein n=1 Tax=Hymenobacter mucosus TaxID=1411120 RepID=UPI000B784841|nr:hypothetical protein [Hymenobacter mucosus]
MNEIVKANKKNSLKYLGWALVGGLIGGIPAEFIAYVTDIDAIAAMGTAGGVLVLLNKKINNEK